MVNMARHRVLVATGCLLWCGSFFGEAYQGQPYSTVGIIISPILTIIGVFYWFKYYRVTRGHFPKFKTIWENTANIGGKFTLNFDFLMKHVLEFWTFCILLWMGLVLIMLFSFRCSDAFEAIKDYCQTNKKVLSHTGEIKYFGVLVAGNMTSGGQGGKADFSFTIVGTKGNFIAKSRLTMESGIWTVENFKLK